jgi:type I restriction enzyme S subunit
MNLLTNTCDEFKDTAMGKIPMDWDFATLESVCLKIEDCQHKTPEFCNTGVLIARTSNIKNGTFDLSFASYVSEKQYESRVSRIQPKPGDVIFTREAPIGEAFVIPEGMRICLGQRTVLLRPDPKKIDSFFLVAQIYSLAVRSQIRQLEWGTTNPHINLADIRSLLISLPSIEEQKNIAEILKTMDKRIDATIQLLTKLKSIKIGIAHDLLTGKKRVN